MGRLAAVEDGDAAQPQTGVDRRIGEAQILEHLQGARGDAKRLAEDGPRRLPLDQQRIDAIPRQFGREQEPHRPGPNDQHVSRMTHLILLRHSFCLTGSGIGRSKDSEVDEDQSAREADRSVAMEFGT